MHRPRYASFFCLFSFLPLWLYTSDVSATQAMDNHDGLNPDNRQKPLANEDPVRKSIAGNQASIDSLGEEDLLGNDPMASLQELLQDPGRWHIHSTDSGPKVKFEFLRIPSESPESLIGSLRFSPDGKYIAIGAMNAAYVYDVETGDKKFTLMHNSTEDTARIMLVRGVSFTSDGKGLITASEDSLIRFWDIDSGTVEATYSGHRGEIYALDFSEDGLFIASAGDDRTVRLWDTETASEIAKFTFPDTPVSVAISSNPAMVIAGSLDGTVSFWAVQGAKSDDEPRHRFQAHKSSVHSVVVSKHNLLVTGGDDNTVRLWPYDPSKGFKQLKHKDRVMGVDVTSDGRWVLSVSPKPELYLSNAETGEICTVIHDHHRLWLSFAVAASPCGRHFATGGGTDFQVWSHSDN